MTEFFSQPDDTGSAKASEATTSLFGSLGAQAADTLDPQDSLSGMFIGRRIREGVAAGNMPHDWDGVGTPEQQLALGDIDQAAKAAIPDVSQDDAKAMLRQEGLTEEDVHLGDQTTHKLPVLKLRIDEAHTRRDRQAAIARGPQGFFPGALGIITSLGVGMIDPVNAAAFSIPVIGEARMGKILAGAGDSILARGAARFGQGAAQGTVGTAALQPADWWLHTNDGKDYTMAQAMESVVMGAGMGGAFHAAIGGIGDVRSRMKGLPLEGSPQDLLLRGLMTGTHVHASALADEGVPLDEVPGISPGIAPASPEVLPPPLPAHPAEILADLPPAAKEDAVHAAMADIIAGRPTQAAEMLNIAADHDPRIAESFEAWHGSPHDFDRFDASRIGTGEGKQSYGHGLYFADREDVARSYGDNLDRDIGFREEADEAHYWLDQADRNKSEAARLYSENAQRNGVKPDPAVMEYLKPGNLYRVRIAADRDQFVDWDASFDAQTPYVRRALQKMGFDEVGNAGSPLGEVIQREMGGRASADASRRLSKAGIAGVRYLDRRWKGSGEHTPNFVVFNDKHIEITHKNGEPVEKEELVAEHKAQQQAKKLARGRGASDPATWSLFEHLASVGGLKPDPELRAIFGNDRGPFIPGFGPLLRKTGKTLDDALTAAKEGGYFIDPTDPAHAPAHLADPAMQGREATFGIRDLLDKVDEESRGRKQYRPDHIEATKYDPAHESHLVLAELEHELAASGAKVEDIDPKLLDRTVEIMKRDGETDVLAAYERAIMEDAERYDATAHERQSQAETSHIPGWDAADVRAASGDGASGAAERGEAGRSDESPRRADGQESPGAGQRNRSSPAVAAADPRWRELADTTPDYNDPETIAESEAADHVPEPDSLVPERSLTALERAAADAEEVWRRLEPTLTEAERAMVNDAMDQLKLDTEARSKIISDGAACLMAAIG